MNIKKMITQNNQLREKLTNENKVYYENLLLYLRFEGIMRDEEKIEAFLLEVLQDILLAQQDGISAKSYFGKEPKVIADDFLVTLPRSLWEGIKLFLLVLVSYAGSSILPSLTTTGKPIDIGIMLITSIYAFIVIMASFKYLASIIYKLTVFIKHKVIRLLVLWVVLMVILAPVLLINFWVHTPFKINVNGVLGIVIIMVLWLIGLFFYLRIADKKFWTPFVFVAFVFGVMGIAARLPYLATFINVKSGRYVYAGLMIFTMVIFYLISYLTIRKMKKETNEH